GAHDAADTAPHIRCTGHEATQVISKAIPGSRRVRRRRGMRTSTVPRPPQIFAVSPVLKPSDSPSGQRSALLEYAISLTGARRAKVCFVTTALGDSQAAIDSL